ncbi:outer membrane channel protein TolC [Shewanella surugensis]|uniref:Outer membrane channel protein TolC n=1 Tax=Shewanella surugensis TaxID=212020 RepID=A0ABT0L6B5_9GAMM|nr:outer membrane channel protein TolC [Shewanella surugensis]MCL1123232.1 outer membrane channel protein TolC [Shewanella surugensis]
MKFKRCTLCLAFAFAASMNNAEATNLLDIYKQALTNDPTVLQAKAERDSLYENINQSRASLLPSISGDISVSRTWDNQTSTVSADGNVASAGLSLSQTLYDGSLWSKLTLSEKTASQADITYADTLQNLIVRVSKAYFSVLTSQDDYRFKKAAQHAYKRQLAQTQERFKVGLSPIADVQSAQAQYDLATAQAVTAKNTLTNNYESLRAITGVDYTDIDILDTQHFSTSQMIPSSMQNWVKLSDNKNLSLLSDEVGKEIANETINYYKAGHLPTLSLSANANKYNEDINNPDYPSPYNYNSSSVALTLNVPIYSGGKVNSQVRQAQDDYVKACEILEQTHRGVIQNVRSDYNNVNASISTIKAYQQSVASANIAAKATLAGFEVGTRTIVDVLNSTSTLYSSKSELSQARYHYIDSVLALKQAAGTLTEKDLIAINKGLITPASTPTKQS